jgi:hypothetical protein
VPPSNRVGWDTFKRDIVNRMKPGEHACLIGPTGRGKSTLGMQLLQKRPYVVVLDAKGGDETLDRSGFEVVHTWPLRDEQARVDSGKPIRVILRPRSHSRDRLAEAHDLFAECIERSLRTGHWTIYVDELRLTSEGRTIDLAPEIEVAYMTGRGRKVSFISATQAPRWIPKASYDQSTHQFHWPLMDRIALMRQAEISGLDRKDFLDLASGLHKHDVLYIRPPDTAMIVRPRNLPRMVNPEAVASVPDDPKPQSPRKGWIREKLWH